MENINNDEFWNEYERRSRKSPLTCEEVAEEARKEYLFSAQNNQTAETIKQADWAYSKAYNEAFIAGVVTQSQLDSITVASSGSLYMPSLTTCTGTGVAITLSGVIGPNVQQREPYDCAYVPEPIRNRYGVNPPAPKRYKPRHSVETPFSLDFEPKEPKKDRIYKKYTLYYNPYKKPLLQKGV
jgi:hypothetical protein